MTDLTAEIPLELVARRFARPPRRPKLSAPDAIAAKNPTHNRLLKRRFDHAAGRKRAAFDIGTTLVSLDSPSVSHTSLRAFAKSSINWSLWNGVGVMRSRSVPRGTVG